MVLISLSGCPASEPKVKITQEEFHEVQNQLWSGDDRRDARDAYLSTERARAILDRRLRQVFGARGISILRGAAKVETFRIADTADIDYGFGRHKDVRSNLGRIEGYTITANGKLMDRAFAERLAACLLRPDRYFFSLDCLPDPGVAFRASRGEESVTLVICYECDHLKVYVRDGWGRIVHTGSSYFVSPFPGPDVMTELAREAFPEDPEIQAMGRKPSESPPQHPEE
jgi:hypothetical protein